MLTPRRRQAAPRSPGPPGLSLAAVLPGVLEFFRGVGSPLPAQLELRFQGCFGKCEGPRLPRRAPRGWPGGSAPGTLGCMCKLARRRPRVHAFTQM